MTDVMTKKQRSKCMSEIKGRDTKPEIVLRKRLWSRNLRYRLNAKILGRPDIVNRQRRLAVFVDGCFWHKCPDHFSAPKSNKQFWHDKIEANVLRDRKVNAALISEGWHVIRIWEHSIKDDACQVVDQLEICFMNAPTPAGKLTVI